MEFQGRLDGKDTATNSKLRIQLDANTADVHVGGDGRGGDIAIKDHNDSTRILLDAGGAENLFQKTELVIPPTITLSAEDATISVGGPFKAGQITVKDKDLKTRIQLDAQKADIQVGGEGRGGDISIKDDLNKTTIFLNGGGSESGVNILRSNRIMLNGAIGAISAGGLNTNGSLSLREGVDSKRRIYLDASGGSVWIGGNGADGDLMLFHKDATEVENTEKATVLMDGQSGSIRLRGIDEAGQLNNRIFLEPQMGDIWLGGNGASGNLLLFPRAGDNSSREQATVRISGQDGDIFLRNADCAEDFDICESVEVEPGTVVVIDDDGKLRPTLVPYDKRVAGVISGAGECRPALVLDKKQSATKRLPVALVGKVYCKVDAQYGPIEVGDLLTTSATPGHAMRAVEPVKAFGAVIGKALRSLNSGQGLIPVLVALQ